MTEMNETDDFVEEFNEEAEVFEKGEFFGEEVAEGIGEGVLRGINFLSSGYHIGVNTVGQSLRNANRQLRSEPPNPQVSVSPWMNSSIGPDLLRRPLEVGDSCGKGGPPPSGNSI